MIVMMRVALIADIHSNLEALRAVLEDAGRRGFDELWCLGDIVGYGPDPVECIELLLAYNPRCVAGNHDLGAIGLLDLSSFNPEAATICRWTANRLDEEVGKYLRGLPLKLVEGDFTLVHGSPRELIWEYILSAAQARENLAYFDTPICAVGHSHIPAAYRDGSGIVFLPEKPLPANGRLIINPGAVGQPRDGDPRASYAVYDDESSSFILHRVPYDIRAVQHKMAGLLFPEWLIKRLEFGI